MWRLPFNSFAVAILLGGCGLGEQPQSEAEIVAEMAKTSVPKAGRWSSHFDLMAFSANGVFVLEQLNPLCQPA